MRVEHLRTITDLVDGFCNRPPAGYDYFSVRQRRIFEALTEGVYYVFNNPVPGNVAEFGTCSGFSAYTIARAMTAYRKMCGERLRKSGQPEKKLHLFDSFEGLPRAENETDLASPNVQTGVWGEGAYKGLTAEELAELCSGAYPAELIHVLAGWYTQTLAAMPAEMKYAMVHLDCDLYSSTLEVLDHLCSRDHLVDGCVIFFDDWNCNQSSPRFGQRKAWREMVEKHHLAYSDCGDYATLGHKFIVHY